jgi:hypothetical protein
MSDTTKFEIVLVRSAPGASGSLAFRDKFIGRYCQGMATLPRGNPSATTTTCVCPTFGHFKFLSRFFTYRHKNWYAISSANF